MSFGKLPARTHCFNNPGDRNERLKVEESKRDDQMPHSMTLGRVSQFHQATFSFENLATMTCTFEVCSISKAMVSAPPLKKHRVGRGEDFLADKKKLQIKTDKQLLFTIITIKKYSHASHSNPSKMYGSLLAVRPSKVTLINVHKILARCCGSCGDWFNGEFKEKKVGDWM